jgi:Ca2+-transporting ATPase
MTVLVAFGWMLARLRAGVPEALVRTEVFTLVVLCQWFNVLNCRSATRTALTGLRHNRWLLGGLAASVVLQALVLYAPPLQAMFHTVALPAGTLAALFALASLVLAAEEIRKALARRRAGAVLRD